MKSQLVTKEFNDLAMEMFGGKPKQQTAVEFIEENLNEFNWEQVFDRAKQMEKEQMLGFYRWMKENDTADNAEKYFHYSDEDMLNEYCKS